MTIAASALEQLKQGMQAARMAGDFGKIAKFIENDAAEFVGRLNIRPGGTIAMATWPQDGFVGKTFAIGARFVPPPEGIPSPLLWGNEEVVKQRLSQGTSSVRTTRRALNMEYPFSSKELVQFFRDYFGPTQMTFSRLDAKGQREYAAALESLWDENNLSAGPGTQVRTEYLEVVATRV